MDAYHKLLQDLLSIKFNKNNSNKRRIFDRFDNTVSSLTNLPKRKIDELKTVAKSRRPIRIKVVKQYFKWTPLDSDIRKRYQKNNQISITFCKYGNDSQNKNCHLDAVRWYNLAALFAVPGDTEPELAAVYANRSHSLYALGMTEDALKDFELVSNYCCSTESKTNEQINERRNELQKKLSSLSNDPVLEQKLTDKVSKMKDFYKEMFTLKSPNSSYPSLEDCVDLKYSTFSRHLMATKDIPIGTTVLVERPFVAILLQALNWDLDHCHHCFKQIFHCIPCSNCVFTLYCNEKCQSEAWTTYHKYECPCLPDLHCNLNDKKERNFPFAFKLMCRIGPQKLFRMFETQKNNGKKSNAAWKDLEDGDEIVGRGGKMDSYRGIYDLDSMYNPDEVAHSILNSLILSRTLNSNTDFFSSVTSDEIEKEDFQDFVAKLIVHHFETFTKNVFTFGQIEGSKGVTLSAHISSLADPDHNNKTHLISYNLEKLGISIYETASWIRHSCNPNLMKCFAKTFGTIALVTIRPIKKDQELFISYGPQYTQDQQSIEARRQVLNRGFGFICNCIACKYNWPEMEELKSKQPTFCCSMCATSFPHEKKMSSEFVDKFKLHEDFKCRSCHYCHNEMHLKNEYKLNCEVLKMCRELIDSNSPIKAIEDVKKSLLFFENNVCPPNFSLLLGNLIFGDAVNQTLYFAKE